ncbi:MAG: phenylacetate--CoA ligase family protein, partial [Dehalococcoidia bacterium]
MLSQLSPEELASLYNESREKMPPKEREKWLNQRLTEQVQFAYQNAPAIKEKFDKAGVPPSEIRTVKDLEKLPVTTKDELARLQQANPPFGGFLAVPLNSLNRIYVSPGPIYDAWGLERVKGAVRGFLRAGWPKPGDVVLVSTAYHMVPAGLFLTDALDLIGCTVVPAGIGQSELQVNLLHDLKATALFSFPSFTMTILKKAEEMGYDVRRDFNLKYTTGGGERHIQILRKTFEEDYGLIVGDGYGTADLGMVAYDCGLGQGYHYEDEDCVVEIVDPDTGRQVGPLQAGEVVVTLFSNVYPLVRFGSGDLASYTDEPCPCGRTAPRITRSLGMVGEHIRVKGMFV